MDVCYWFWTTPHVSQLTTIKSVSNQPVLWTPYIYLSIHRVSQEERARLWEGVPYVKVCWYKPKHLVQSGTVMAIMVREKFGLLVVPHTVPVSWQILSKFVFECGVRWQLTLSWKLHICFLQGMMHCAVSHITSMLAIHVCCIVLGTLKTTMTCCLRF
jgi:hypothetical protein